MIVRDEYLLTLDNTNLPLSTNEVNAHLKETFSDITTEPLIPILIKAVEKFGEQFTRRVFLTKTYTNYRTNWVINSIENRVLFELRRSKLIAISSVKYIDIDDDEQTIADTNYDNTLSDEYSNLYFVDNFSFPNLSSQKPQPIIIEFTAGYGSTESSIPGNIKTAMLNHLAILWKNRGDCPDSGKGFTTWMDNILPPASKFIYSMERIPDIIL